MRLTVLLTEGSAPAPLAWLRERADVLELAVGAPGFDDALAAADGLIVRTYTKVTPELLARAPRLRVIGRGGVGLENIDLAACRARGVQVVYTPDANTQAVAEFVFGLMLKLVRPWWENAPGLFSAQQFSKYREDAGEHLGDLVLGLLGMGRAGRAVARIAQRGFGMRVRYHDLLDVSPHVDVPAEAVTFDELVAGCDILSLHVDGRAANRGLIGEAALAAGRFRWLINTSRGLVVDAAALERALTAGRLRGAALDVYDPEPPPAESAHARLIDRFGDRVILTPHMASRTVRAGENMSWVVRDVMAVLEGRRPQWPAPDAS